MIGSALFIKFFGLHMGILCNDSCLEAQGYSLSYMQIISCNVDSSLFKPQAPLTWRGHRRQEGYGDIYCSIISRGVKAWAQLRFRFCMDLYLAVNEIKSN